MSSLPENPHHLTDKGKKQIAVALESLKGKSIDLIYVSPMARTQETARMVKEGLGLSEEQIITDSRLVDNAGGIFENKPVSEWYEYRNRLTIEEKLTDAYEGGESWRDIKKRMTEVLFEIEHNYKDKNVLIISHGMPMQLMQWTVGNVPHEEMVRRWENEPHFATAEVAEISFIPYPHNEFFETDFHRPYIDEIELYEGDVKLERVPDVFDCWFESGSMPYGQHHYPFACEDTFEKESFPAQFIAEGLDQTRGWFYSMLVLGVALFGKSPYENVIVNGLVLAEDGKKMSKSLQNYPDPMELADRQGIDAMRFYLLSSPVIKGEDLNFSEKEVNELQRKNIGRLHNVLAMYEMFADGTKARDNSDNVLDQWIVARLNKLITESTTGYKSYELDKATRPLTDFIDDLSVWYLRRSRDRLKGDDEVDKAVAIATLRHVLRTLALTMAPAMPFYAEYLWQQVKEDDDVESVHLGVWPQGGKIDAGLLEDMEEARRVVTLALEQRTKANIKVRQPIASITGPELTSGLRQIVLDELNAKDYKVGDGVAIDTTLTEALITEGSIRELMRAVQGERKKQGLEPEDRVIVHISTSEVGQAAVQAHKDLFIKTVGANEVSFTDTAGESLTTETDSFVFAVEKQ